MTGSRPKGNLQKHVLPWILLVLTLLPSLAAARDRPAEGPQPPETAAPVTEAPAPADAAPANAADSAQPAPEQEPAPADEPASPAASTLSLIPRTDWSITFEPALMKPRHALALAGSADIYIVPAELRDWIWQEMEPNRFTALRTPMETYLRQAVRNTLPLLEDVEPQYYRNPQEVIEYGLLRSEEEDPRLPTVILLPEFYQRFEPIFGPDFLVVLPNRLSVYLFPRLAGNLDEHAAMLLRVYETSQYPATSLSKDIFVVTENGVVLGGRLLDPRTDPIEWFTDQQQPQAAFDLRPDPDAPDAPDDAAAREPAEPLSIEPRHEQAPALRPGSYR